MRLVDDIHSILQTAESGAFDRISPNPKERVPDWLHVWRMARLSVFEILVVEHEFGAAAWHHCGPLSTTLALKNKKQTSTITEQTNQLVKQLLDSKKLVRGGCDSHKEQWLAGSSEIHETFHASSILLAHPLVVWIIMEESMALRSIHCHATTARVDRTIIEKAIEI